MGVSLGLSLLSGAAGYGQAQQQYAADVEMYKQNAENVRAATVAEYASEQNRIHQERVAAQEKKFDQEIANLRQSSTAAVAAGEGGVTGNTVEALLGDYYAAKGRANDAVDNNFQMRLDYLRGEMDATKARGQDMINRVPIPRAPSPLMILGGLG